MTANELYNKMSYTGMERDVRKLAVKNHPKMVNDIALMNVLEVCDILCKDGYEILYSEGEEIGLAKSADISEIMKKLEIISR